VFNITDDEGPLAPSITVYYQPPELVADKPPSPSKPLLPFAVSSTYRYLGYGVNQEASWQISVAGGTPPYAFNVKWGDGSEANYVQKDASNLTISHSYGKEGIYALKVLATDVNGNTGFLQMTALVVKDQKTLITGTNASGGPPLAAAASPQEASFLQRWRWVLLPSYGVVGLMALSFWLGEQQEYRQLLRVGRHLPHHHA
jgi:hypothetical protein